MSSAGGVGGSTPVTPMQYTQNTAEAVFGEIKTAAASLMALCEQLVALNDQLKDLRAQKAAVPRPGEKATKEEIAAFNKTMAEFDNLIQAKLNEIANKQGEILKKQGELDHLQNNKLPQCQANDRAAAQRALDEARKTAENTLEAQKKALSAGNEDDAAMQLKKKLAQGMVTGGPQTPGVGIGPGVP